MQYYRCRCGKRTYHESGMPPRECQGCEKCQTTFAQHPDGHDPLQTHDWGEVRVEGPESAPTRWQQCKRCYARKKLPADDVITQVEK